MVADSQTSGRGRLGRRWFSPGGQGLWCTVILRPDLPLRSLGALPLAASVAAAGAIEAATGFRCGVKWPNDLMAGARKLGGILSEASAPAGGGSPEFVLLGVGVNVSQSAADFPDDLRDRASSLLIEGCRVSPSLVGACLMRELSSAYGLFRSRGFAALKQRWMDLATMIGCRVQVSGAGEDVSGTASGIDDNGCLLLRLPAGEMVALAAGDLSLRGVPGGGSRREGCPCSLSPT